MERPKVRKGDWIRINPSETSRGIDGYILNVRENGVLDVGYYQNQLKAIKEEVIWKEDCWKFKYSGPNGSYLRGMEETIVKRGPSK